MTGTLRLVEAPVSGSLAVSLAIAKAHLNLDASFTADDALIAAYIGAATARVEQLGRSLVVMASTWAYDLDQFENVIQLPRSPVTEVSAVTYLDRDGIEQTLDPAVYSSKVDAFGSAVLRLAYGIEWPAVLGADEDITITFKVGYADEAVPHAIQAAILLIVGSLYEQRAEVTSRAVFEVPGAVDALVAPYRVWAP